MSEESGFPALNVPQRRHFEVVFASLEDALARVEQQAGTTTPDQRMLTQRAADVRDDFIERAAPRGAARPLT